MSTKTTYKHCYITEDLRPTLKGQFINPVYEHTTSKEDRNIFIKNANNDFEINISDFLAD